MSWCRYGRDPGVILSKGRVASSGAVRNGRPRLRYGPLNSTSGCARKSSSMVRPFGRRNPGVVAGKVVRRNSLIRPCSSVATSEGIIFLPALTLYHRDTGAQTCRVGKAAGSGVPTVFRSQRQGCRRDHATNLPPRCDRVISFGCREVLGDALDVGSGRDDRGPIRGMFDEQTIACDQDAARVAFQQCPKVIVARIGR